MKQALSKKISLAVTPKMKEELLTEAFHRRVLPSTLIRDLLNEGLERRLREPLPLRREYEILLDDKDAKRLRRLGYELKQEAQEGPTPSLSGLLASVHKN